jgi:cobalt/nickel transport system permease protein
VNTQLDTLAYGNRLRQLPPVQKLSFALVVLGIAIFSHYPVQIAIFLWLSIWIVGYAGIPRAIYISMMVGVMMFLVTSLPALIINFASNAQLASLQQERLWGVNFGDGQLYLSHQGVRQAIDILTRSMASTTALFFIILTTPFIELAETFNRWGCPPILTELLLLSYRFIFLLAEVAQKIVTAQQARGGYRTRRLAMNSVSLLIRQLIQRTASRYQQLTLGVKARGFQQEFRFWQPYTYQYSQRYGLEAISGCLLLTMGEILYRIYV